MIIKKNKKIIGLCHGVFDLIHIGHINHFKSAKKKCDYLIISVTKDEFIKKGYNRPLFNQTQRLDFLKSLSFVDEVYLCKSQSAEDSIKKFKPNFYFKGPDYKNNSLDLSKKIYLEKKLTKKFGGVVVYTDDVKFSSTRIINKHSLNLNKEQAKFILNLKKKHEKEKILNSVDKILNTKIIVMGEQIFDDYCYGEALNKASKDPYLSFLEERSEKYIGGVAAIANNVSTFTNNIILITNAIEEKINKKIFNDQISKNIVTNFFQINKNNCSIVKKRYIDAVSNYKLFGSYIIPNITNNISSKKIIKFLKYSNSECIIAADYGHGFFDNALLTYISECKKKVFVNVQINSSNLGYQSLFKYQNIDSLFVNEGELRFQYRDKVSDIKQLLQKIKKNKIRNIFVTRGAAGVIACDAKEKFYSCPAFSEKVIDKVGAGDTFLAVTAAAMASRVPMDISLFIGSLCAGYSVGYHANKKIIVKENLLNDINSLL